MDIFLNYLIQFYLNKTTNLRHLTLTRRINRVIPTKWRSYRQRRNSFITGPQVRFGRGPYLYIFIKSHAHKLKVNICLMKKRFFKRKRLSNYTVVYLNLKLVNTGTFHGKFFDHLVEVRVLSALVFDADDRQTKGLSLIALSTTREI